MWQWIDKLKQKNYLKLGLPSLYNFVLQISHHFFKILVNYLQEIFLGIYLETFALIPLCKLFSQRIKPGHVGVEWQLC